MSWSTPFGWRAARRRLRGYRRRTHDGRPPPAVGEPLAASGSSLRECRQRRWRSVAPQLRRRAAGAPAGRRHGRRPAQIFVAVDRPGVMLATMRRGPGPLTRSRCASSGSGPGARDMIGQDTRNGDPRLARTALVSGDPRGTGLVAAGVPAAGLPIARRFICVSCSSAGTGAAARHRRTSAPSRCCRTVAPAR